MLGLIVLFRTASRKLTMLAYVPYGGEHIATPGTNYFMVAMAATADGKVDQGKAAIFDTMDEAKAFIDGGKTGPHETCEQRWERRKLLQSAFVELGRMGGNTIDSPYRKAWEALRDIVTP